MPEVVSCPDCGRKLRLPDAVLGKRVQCPSCGARFQATAAAGEEPIPEVLPAPSTTSPKPVRKDPLSEFEEEDRLSMRRPPRAQPSGSNAAVTVLSILLTVLFLCAGGIKVILLLEKWSKERGTKAGPVATKVFAPLEGRWENDRGYIVFRKEDRSFKGRYVGHTMEKVTDGAKETAYVTGGGPEYWLNRLVDGELVFVKSVRFTYDEQTLTYWDEDGRQSVYQRKAEAPNGK